MTLTKAELADLLFEKVGLNKREAKDMVEAFFEEIRGALERVLVGRPRGDQRRDDESVDDALRRATIGEPRVPVYANVTAEPASMSSSRVWYGWLTPTAMTYGSQLRLATCSRESRLRMVYPCSAAVMAALRFAAIVFCVSPTAIATVMRWPPA